MQKPKDTSESWKRSTPMCGSEPIKLRNPIDKCGSMRSKEPIRLKRVVKTKTSAKR